jgi:hypothetical protein
MLAANRSQMAPIRAAAPSSSKSSSASCRGGRSRASPSRSRASAAVGAWVAMARASAAVFFQPRPGHHVEERPPVADVQALGEVRPEQRLHHGVLGPLLPREPDQAMGIEGVQRAVHPVECEHQALLGTGRGHLGIESLRPLPVAELGGAVCPPVHAAPGHLRVQLERVPTHAELVPARKGGDGLPARVARGPRTTRGILPEGLDDQHFAAAVARPGPRTAGRESA